MKNNHWSKKRPNDFAKHIKIIQTIRNSFHKLNCQCCACKAKRGEYKGRKPYIRTPEIKEKTRKSITVQIAEAVKSYIKGGDK